MWSAVDMHHELRSHYAYFERLFMGPALVFNRVGGRLRLALPRVSPKSV